MQFPTLLQLDTKLNLGMSGGAVINLKGELVGITTMASSPAGFDALAGYAVPMDRIIRRAIATLKEGKEVEYGLLGLRADAKFSNFVSELTENSPAELGQLRNQRPDHCRERHPRDRFRVAHPGGERLSRGRSSSAQDSARR